MDTMKLLRRLIQCIPVCCIALLLISCPDSRPSSPSRDNGEDEVPSHEMLPDSSLSNGQATPSPESENVEETIINKAMGMMASLGYDVSALEINSMEFNPTDFSLVWMIRIGDDLSDFAGLGVNEETMRVEFLTLKVREDDPVCQALIGDESSADRIIDAMDIETEKYIRISWQSGIGNMVEFRKYVTRDEWEIAVGQVHIATSPEPGAPVLMNLIEHELMSFAAIETDRDSAVSAAASFLGSPVGDPTHAELIQLRSEPYGPDDFTVYWEVVFDDRVVHVNSGDGSIIGAP